MAEERDIRIQHLEALRKLGINPYPNAVERTHSIADVIKDFDTLAGPDKSYTLVGRIRLLREMGKASFAQIEDGTGRIQVYIRINDIGADTYQLLKLLDLGDFIQVSGFLFYTRTGEKTLHVQSLRVLSKSLRPLPEKYHGLEDRDTRQRKRYLDLIANGDEIKNIFVTRSRMITAMRQFLDNEHFVEVETPILQPLYGGANARPFTTHHNTLDRDLFLRIAIELYHKRLLVGGFERVYEIGRNFRNEGIDRSHNPEFTMIEFYMAYADYNHTMALVENMLAFIAQQVKGSTHITYQETDIDLAPPWKRYPLLDAIHQFTGIDVRKYPDRDSLAAEMRARHFEVDPRLGYGRLIDDLKSAMFRQGHPELRQALFLVDYPEDVSPLTKQHRSLPGLVERFQPFIGGLECGNAYTELNDPLDQRARFEDQARQRAQGDDEAQVLDEDFLEALEVGMPPTSGVGLGIDRLAMLLANQESIRDVILFPTMRKTAEEQS
ncbi:lysine--tRNA ligase [Dictyobacter kobayashii]|uniref:Lysine--tRNA ligase n=1 Tax=Dictyobacter kobayashii TaxID=2014872 RepID=A0A402AMP1_9CHLR|nr:lysine--tRNA ligase [Dictyobacter kobayashii]GCE20407.1 lysine--tRNA ligase [Dictyobacter kobayashii]